jgi:hypothetical protein
LLWQDILVPFIFTRFGILLIGVTAIYLGKTHTHWHVSSHAWIDLMARWDSKWYLSIATNGYSYSQGKWSNVAFFPLYPLLMKMMAFGAQDIQLLTIAGWFVSNISTILALILFYRLIIMNGDTTNVARRAVWLLAFFPTSFYFSVVYTEGLFLLLAVGAFYFARKRRWLIAGILGGLSAATRFIGVLLLIPLAYEWLQQKPRHWLSVLTLFLVPCGLLAYMLYLKHTFGDPLLFVKAQEAWRRTTGIISAIQRLNYLLTTPGLGPRILSRAADIAFLVVGGVLLLGVFWRQRLSYQLYAFYALAVPLATLQVVSIPRYLLVIFPLFIVMAQWLKKSVLYHLTLTIFGLLQAALVVRWSLGYWVA